MNLFTTMSTVNFIFKISVIVSEALSLSHKISSISFYFFTLHCHSPSHSVSQDLLPTIIANDKIDLRLMTSGIQWHWTHRQNRPLNEQKNRGLSLNAYVVVFTLHYQLQVFVWNVCVPAIWSWTNEIVTLWMGNSSRIILLEEKINSTSEHTVSAVCEDCVLVCLVCFLSPTAIMKLTVLINWAVI